MVFENDDFEKKNYVESDRTRSQLKKRPNIKERYIRELSQENLFRTFLAPLMMASQSQSFPFPGSLIGDIGSVRDPTISHIEAPIMIIEMNGAMPTIPSSSPCIELLEE